MPDKFIATIKQLINGSLEDPDIARYTGVTIRIRDGNEEVTIQYKAYGEDDEEQSDEP